MGFDLEEQARRVGLKATKSRFLVRLVIVLLQVKVLNLIKCIKSDKITSPVKDVEVQLSKNQHQVRFVSR